MAKKKKASKARRATKRTPRPAKNHDQLTAASTVELEQELRRRQASIDRLHRRRAKLVAELAEVDSELASVGGIVGGGKRPRNDQNLADALVDVLNGRTLSVTEASIEVQKAGYKTTSSSFRTIVNQTLLKDKRFKKVERGRYTVA